MRHREEDECPTWRSNPRNSEADCKQLLEIDKTEKAYEAADGSHAKSTLLGGSSGPLGTISIH